MTLYLERLIKTESQSLLRKFIACHGVIILKHCVSAYEKKGNFDIVLMVSLFILDRFRRSMLNHNSRFKF